MNITIDNNTGGLAFWTNVSDTTRSVVVQAAEAAGIGRHVPEQTPASTALRNAMEEYAKDRFGRRRNEPIQLLQTAQPRTFECVRCVRGSHENEHRYLFSAEVDEDGAVNVLQTNESGHVRDNNTCIADFNVRLGLKGLVREQMTILPGPVITRSLAAGMREWGCQCLNDRGGLWFLPSSCVGNYTAWADVFKNNTECQFVLAEVQVSHNPEFVEHLISEVQSDVLAGLHEITTDMLNAEGGMQDRSIRLRIERTQEFMDKVAQYESITGVAMGSMRDAIEKTRQALAMQKMMASAV